MYPGAIPFTTPVVVLIVAIVVLLLLHVPPDAVWLRIVVSPTQMLVLPTMDDKVPLTVTSFVV